MSFEEKDLIRSTVERIIELEYDSIMVISVKSGMAKYIGQTDESMQYFMSDSFSYKESMKEYMEHFSVTSKERDINRLAEVNFIVSQLEADETYETVCNILKEDGTKRSKRIKYFYVGEGKEYIGCIRTDVTSVSASEQEELKEMQKVLAESKRTNDATAAFFSRVNHDVRTPMNGILGLTKLTLEIPDIFEEVKTNIQAIDDACQYMLGLMNDTFDLSKIESNRIILDPEVVHTKKFVEHIKAYIMPAAKEKNIELKMIPINTDLAYIRVDRMRLQQILTNLLTNAVKLTPADGTVECMVERLKHEKGYYYDKITIRDNGIGMSPEFLEKAFEPFLQEMAENETTFSGSGLGLYIVKNLVEIMEGTIEIKSNLGVGTEVIMQLPFEEVSDEEAKDNTYSQAKIDLSGKNILLCEDHPLNTKITVKLLEKVGCKVETAENGKIGLEMFEEKPSGYYDLILMDIRMPEMDGLTATRNIRALGKDDSRTIPIIAMTANAFDEDVRASKAAGLNEHLAKLVDTILLYDVLQKFLQK